MTCTAEPGRRRCGEELISRDWYELLDYRLTSEGKCPKCGAALAGRFDARPGRFGRRRVPVRMGGAW